MLELVLEVITYGDSLVDGPIRNLGQTFHASSSFFASHQLNELAVQPFSWCGIDIGIPSVNGLLTLVVPSLQDNMLWLCYTFAVFFSVIDVVAHCLIRVWKLG